MSTDALPAELPADLSALMDRTFTRTERVLGAVPASAWGLPSPCEGWTVRDAGSHAVAAVRQLAGIAAGRPPTPAELADDSDGLGDDSAAAFRASADRALAVFGDPETLLRTATLPVGDAPGWVVGLVAMREALVHGWDVARPAGLPYPVTEAELAPMPLIDLGADGVPGMFGAARPAPAGAGSFEQLLARLGRAV